MTLDYEVYKEGGILNNRYQKIEDISEGSYGYVSLAKDIQKKKLVAVKYIFKVEKEEEEEAEGEEVKEDVDGKEDVLDVSDTVRSRSSQEKRVQLVKHRKSLIASNVKSRLSENLCFEAVYEIEIQNMIGNDHKNIVKLLDFFDSYIILEYCSGGDLYEAIKSDLIPRKTKKITHILTQIIDAIQYVHSKNIYHRDIKPENILISNLFDWTIKLSDWGLATTHQKSLDRNVGSERYMAPELFESNLDIEERKEAYQCDKVDVWSIGIVFLNIVFSKNPFSVANQSDKSFCYFAANREALFDVFSTMSLDFFQVLRYSLTIDPSNRDLDKMRLELNNLSEYTLDDEFYNTLQDDEIAISDEESQPLPPYVPPSSAPVPVSLPTPISSSIGKAKKRFQSSDSSTPKDPIAINNTNVMENGMPSSAATTPVTAGSTPEDKKRAKSVPKFKFQKRSHLQKGNSPNQSQNNGYSGKPIKNTNGYNNHNNYNYNNYTYYNNNNNHKNYYFNGNKPKIIKHSRKPLGIPTPNTHINNYFHDYQKNRHDDESADSNQFNTRDYFTPPSVNNRYMEGIFSHYQPNKQNNKHHYFPTNGSKAFNKNTRRPSTGNRLSNLKVKQISSSATSSSVPVQHSPGKYIPPNARSYYTSQFQSYVPDISTVLNAPTYHEQYTNNEMGNGKSDSNGGVDLDDVLFTLEENDHDFIQEINSLSLQETQTSSHIPNHDGPARNDLPDLLKSPVPSKQQLNGTVNPFANQLLNVNGNDSSVPKQPRKSVTSEHKYKAGVYIPPHHRKSSASPTAASEATLSVMRNSFNYSTSFNSRRSSANAEPSRSYQAPFLTSLNNHSTTTTALQDKDIFAHTDNDAILFSEDESDTESSRGTRSMFGPYEIYNNNSVPFGKLHTARKSSTLQDEAVGSLEQYKNNWLMLQQQQD